MLGECLVDLAPETERLPAGGPANPRRSYVALPGGGPANVAVGLARLGVSTAFAGRFAKSGFGPWLRANLEANGVDLSPSVEAEEPATLAVVTLDGEGRASYTFYGPETADWHWARAELPVLPEGCVAVHTGSLVTSFEPSASVLTGWLAELRAQGEVAISFDPNVRPGLVGELGTYRHRLEGLVASSHLVKASEEDIAAAYPGASAESVAGQWLEAGPSLVVVTEGARGARALHRSGAEARCEPPPVEVVDTIGAGDAFSSGLLACLSRLGVLSPVGLGRLSGRDLEAALIEAVAASALTCTRVGADPPTEGDLASFQKSWGKQPYGPSS